MKTYTICGSMRFWKEMQEIAYFLEINHGYNILQCVYNPGITDLTNDQIKNLEFAQYRRIDLSDGIYVIDLDGYIGDSTSKEIEYARRKDKQIIYHSLSSLSR
ncbi:MAG: hypothetical protein IJO13_11625 [Lachnospiraceae bacterium]|nr:hypothetical protein [Lachnospiraceae bacterium]